MNRLLIVLGAILLSFNASIAVAQDATPVPDSGCAIEPRTQDEVNALAAIANATPPSDSTPVTMRLPEGEPVDEQTIEELLRTLDEADACAAERDLLRFLALYSDYFIVRYVFGNEPVGIAEGGQPTGQVNAAGTPVTQVNVIDGAVQLEDGIIAAHVFVTGVSDFGSIVWFVQHGDRWIILEIASAGDPPQGRADIPADAEGIVERVVEDAAGVLGTEPDEVTVASFKPVDWPDASLGCPEEDGIYAAVITPGYRVVVTAGDGSLTYHTDLAGALINCSDD